VGKGVAVFGLRNGSICEPKSAKPPTANSRQAPMAHPMIQPAGLVLVGDATAFGAGADVPA